MTLEIKYRDKSIETLRQVKGLEYNEIGKNYSILIYRYNRKNPVLRVGSLRELIVFTLK